MKIQILLSTVLSLNLINLNEAFNDGIVRVRFGIKKYNLDLSNVNITKQCGAKEKCIWKCCPEGEIMGIFKTCVKSNIKITNVTVYDRNHMSTNKSLQSVFKMVPNLLKDDIFAKNALWWYTAYLTDDGRLFLKVPNVYNRWKDIQTNHFCVDMKLNTTKPVFMVEYEIDQPRNPSTYKKWALVISILSLVMALVVYSVVPELRDLNGIILMVQLCCLIVTFITNCILESFNTMSLWMSEIITVSFFHYFFKVSIFSWTNIIFYRLLMSSSRSKELPVSWSKQLIKYSTYAFGLPFFMTILTATIELSDMTDTPSFVTPQIQNRGNFSFQEMESLYYLYFPLLILLAFNWIVCFIKVIEFCKKSKQFSPVTEARHVDTEELNRPMQFVKLNTLLTAYVVVEMLTVIFLKGTHDTQAAYTMCIGPIVLIIFIWNKNVLPLFLENLKTCKKRTSNSNHLVAIFQKK